MTAKFESSELSFEPAIQRSCHAGENSVSGVPWISASQGCRIDSRVIDVENHVCRTRHVFDYHLACHRTPNEVGFQPAERKTFVRITICILATEFGCTPAFKIDGVRHGIALREEIAGRKFEKTGDVGVAAE